MIYANLALAKKLERTEAKSNVSMVETRARLFSNSQVSWINVAGAYAMFDGISSPLTQTFGLGLFEHVTETDLDKIERFFKDRNASVFHEVR